MDPEMPWLERSPWEWKRRMNKLTWNSTLKILRVWHPVTLWQISKEKLEAVTDFFFLNSKITVDSDCHCEIKRCLLLGRKGMINLDSVLKSRDIILLTNVQIVKAMVFPVVLYICESWSKTLTLAEPWKKMMLSNCDVGEDFWESMELQWDQDSQS